MSKGAPDYTKITLLKGAAPDGSLVTLAVDASGNILAVLKGEYGGVLKTVQTDVNGMLLAKIYDPDDIFGVSGTIGLGELAARLGSIMNFDRRGQYVWGDDFEQGTLKWNVTLAGTGAAVALDATKAYRGTQSVKLTAGTSYLKSAAIHKHLAIQATGRIGIEGTISPLIAANINMCYFFVTQQTAIGQCIGALIWDITNSKLQIRSSSGDYTDVVSPYAATDVENTWHKFKLVVDFSTKKYVRLMYGDAQIDISENSMQEGAITGTPILMISFYLFTNGTTSGIVNVDDIVVTQGEP